jgi:hypothetical protein
MRRLTGVYAVAAAAGLAFLAGPGWTQQATVATPATRVGDSFSESIGTSWGANFKGIRFQGIGQGAPAAGSANASGGRMGFGWGNSGGNGFFNANFGQGSSRSLVGQTPMVTGRSGQPGFVSDSSQSPFVVGSIPVAGGHVGGFPSLFGFSPIVPGSMVQLPTWSMFGGMGTVSVPDRGNALLGGVNRAASGANQAGIPGLPGGNRSSGSQMGAAGQRVVATIHNMQKIDEALLAGAADSAPVASDAGRQALAASQVSSAGQAVPSVADARREREAELNAKNAESLAWLEKAQTAERDGKLGLAKVYYQMVARKASGELRERAVERLEALRTASSASVAQPEQR